MLLRKLVGPSRADFQHVGTVLDQKALSQHGTSWNRDVFIYHIGPLYRIKRDLTKYLLLCSLLAQTVFALVRLVVCGFTRGGLASTF